MKILLFGATGMVGQGVLRECLAAPDVVFVTTVGRTPLENTHPKLRQQVYPDLFQLEEHSTLLQGFDACFFCLGVSSSGMDEATYHHLTYDLTLSIATLLSRLNPGMTFVYVSGVGTDSSEQGRSMWARVKGKTENALQKLPFRSVYLFRPGLIVPLHGIESKTPVYRWFYRLIGPVLFIIRRLFPRSMVTTETMGQAMLNMARQKTAERVVLEPADIHRMAGS